MIGQQMTIDGFYPPKPEGAWHCLVACEESQAVTIELRKRGHIAWSCDLQECSGGHPEWHIQGDCLPLLNGNCTFTTQDGHTHTHIGKWDLIIAHPPCTYLSYAATQSHSLKVKTLEEINERTLVRIDAMKFFMVFAMADCERIAIENPIGVMNSCYRAPDQIIDPYEFAESTTDTANYVTKSTCLWLKNLPCLIGNELERPDNGKVWGFRDDGKAYCWTEMTHTEGGRAKARSKTFPGIAKAMAEQWTT